MDGGKDWCTESQLMNYAGATFYEMLSGKVPFHQSIDPLELIHKHIGMSFFFFSSFFLFFFLLFVSSPVSLLH